MKFTPGERFSYCNAGYILLGSIVEKICGVSFQQYVETNIFRPSNMKDSGFFAMDCLPSRTAYGYLKKGNDEWRTNIYTVPIIGGSDGGAFTTAFDVAAFWNALFSCDLVSRSTLTTMLTPHVATAEKDVHYGYGMWMTKQNNTIVIRRRVLQL